MTLLNRLAAGLCALVALVLAGCASVAEAPDIFASREVHAASRDEVWFVYLESGKKGFTERAALEEMQRGHIANFQRLFGEKKLLAAGPLKDPSEFKRGIVIAKAPSQQALAGYFQPDQYVREGYLKLNAVPALANRPLATEGIDSSGVEEVRIVQLMRGERALSAGDAAAQRAALQRLVDQGTFGAWYTLEAGPVAEVLFSRNRDDRALQAALAGLPSIKAGAPVAVWVQWFAKGVLR
ncbi:MAG: hypothetical protein IPM15_01215 [Betaproteobacteria bacterium]|nr:hypothetical protein [Betaproteobacteria bacterium]